MQQCFHPVAVCDVRFDDANKRSNENGDWPVVKPTLRAGALETRELAVFNDEFAGEEISVAWELRRDKASGPVHEQGAFTLRVPLGEYRRRPINFTLPRTLGDVVLVLRGLKAGEERFREEAICFEVIP
jgi:hypothetical protein